MCFNCLCTCNKRYISYELLVQLNDLSRIIVTSRKKETYTKHNGEGSVNPLIEQKKRQANCGQEKSCSKFSKYIFDKVFYKKAVLQGVFLSNEVH